MKKLLFLISLILIFVVPYFPLSQKSASAVENPIYAKIAYNNVYLYCLPENKDENRLFMLPYTYFVKLLSNEGDDFYYVQYEDIFGYIKKNSVTPMKGTPVCPYATSNFRVFSLDGIGLYDKPQIEEEKLADIPYLSQDLVYYGIMQGQEVIPEKSNQWYYAKYSTTGRFGYVYSVFCDKLAKIEENTESFDIISTPLFNEEKASKELTPVAMTFIILGVSLPCLIVLYLLIKPTMLTEKLTKERPKLRAKRRRDYFEFDESDLN